MALTGNSIEEKIYNFLYSRIKNAFGVSGLMGNLYAESGLVPTNLQNSFEKKLGYTDGTYTTSVDNGDYTNFVHDSAGYGLAQWTYWSRKENLLLFVHSRNQSIGDLESQLEFLYQELSTGYKAVLTKLKAAKSVREASDIVLTQYERPADQSESVKKKRASYSQKYYDRYAKTTGGKSSMGKTITTGFISATINGINVDSSIKCNADNYNSNASRNAAFVAMHYTGNSKDTARANANYFAGAGRNASAHFFVDDTEIRQSVALKDTAWGVGAKSYKHASCRNANCVNIEMCCTAGNYRISDKTKGNAAYLCAYICNLLGITAAEVDTYVLRHYDVTGKNCPAQMAGSGNAEWAAFKTRVKEILNGGASSGNSGSSSGTNGSFPATPFQVKVLVSDLNIRSNPSMGNNVKGQTGKGVFTITEVNDGWGKLKSGAGWIYLENKEYVTVLGSSSGSSQPAAPAKKSVDEVAKEVLRGDWGNGADRKKRLEAAGYNYAQVQAAVNRLCK